MSDDDRHPFAASARLPGAKGDQLIDGLSRHLDPHADVARLENGLLARTGGARLTVEAAEDGLRIEARTADPAMLAYMKALAGEVSAACGAAFEIAWTDRRSRRPVLRVYRRMRVTAVEALTPRMRRVTLAGLDLSPFASGGLHVGLHLGRDPATPPPDPRVAPGGRLVWPAGASEPAVRAYTLRRVDVARGTVTIDLLLHAAATGRPAPGARFAAEAAPGMEVGMWGPSGGDVPAAERILLCGDETALPMIARVMERLDPGTRVDALLLVDGPDDVLPLASPAGAAVRWIARREGEAAFADAVEAGARRVAAEGGFVFHAGEMETARRLKLRLRDGLGLDPSRFLSVGFWRR